MTRAMLPLFLALSGCASAGAQADAPTDPARLAAELAELHGRFREEAITGRRFTHRELWEALGPRVDGAAGMEREEVGRSVEGRPLFAVRYGRGATRVLLWSQMHGNESTATMALADVLRFLAESPEHPLARRLRDRLTVVAVPMLNPDGAERFQRRNALGIDVNRDARALATPEGRALRELQRTFRPDFGFNLHDQDVRARVGTSDRLAAIALLAPAFDEAGSDNPVRARAKRVAAAVRGAVEPLVAGHVTRYDDTYSPRAFGDGMQRWGTSTVLMESGGWRDDPEKQYLRRVNFVALLSALDAIATGAYAAADPAAYESLPENGRQVNDLLVRGGTLVLPGAAPFRADLAVDYADAPALAGGRVVDVGDLAELAARDTLDAAGLFLHPAPEMLAADSLGRAALATGAPARFTVRRGPEPASETVWTVDGGAARRAGAP
ncbi:MAG TPA: M14 family zinc carboxypeptidase [Longimicrobiaceae bacterium]|nr:M14 family zinc carboxypeptidase [Longimicrobiaceae bacterium]